MKRIINNPGKFPTKDIQYAYSKVGRITRVDYETMSVDVVWLSESGGMSSVRMTAPGWSKRAFVGVMYEEDQLVLCDFIRMGDSVDAFINRSLPCLYRKGLNHDLHRLKDPVDGVTYSNYYKVELEGDTVKSDESGYFEFTRYKFRKLYPGDALIASSGGSEVLVDDSVTLSSASLDTLKLDSNNNQLILNTLQKIEYLDGVRSFTGSVERPIIESFKEDGSRSDEPPEELEVKDPPESQNTFISGDTHKRWMRTLCGEESPSQDPPEGASELSIAPFSESRAEIQEFGDMLLSVNPHLHGVDLNYNDMGHKKALKERNSPIIEHSSGTLVGFDSVLRPDTYGKVLQPQIYDLGNIESINSTNTKLDEIEVTDIKPDYPKLRLFPAAYMWKMPNEFSLTRFYLAKEGNLSFFIGSTWDEEDIKDLGLEPQTEFEHQLGAGRAIDGYLAGSLKLVIDKNKNEEESIILDTIGQVRFHFGKDDAVKSSERRECKFNRKGEEEELITGVTNPKLEPGDGEAESLSIIGTLDGGMTLRVGANHAEVKRKFYKNGFNAKGDEVDDSVDVRNEERQTYGDGDSTYRFHDLTQIAYSAPEFQDDPLTDPDIAGHSLDAHLVQNLWLRVGKDKEDEKSLNIDTDGSANIFLGKDKIDDTSLSLETDGGIRAAIGYSKEREFSLATKMYGGIIADIGIENEFDRSLILDMAGGIDARIGKDNVKENSLKAILAGGITAGIGVENQFHNSINIVAEGGIDAQVGVDNIDNQSLVLELDGGMKVKIGKNNSQQQSVNVEASNGMEFNIVAADNGGFALKMTMTGDVLLDVDGDFTVNANNHTFAGPGGGSSTTVTAKGDFKTPDDTTQGHTHSGMVPEDTDKYS